jgi:hypothetical protein
MMQKCNHGANVGIPFYQLYKSTIQALILPTYSLKPSQSGLIVLRSLVIAKTTWYRGGTSMQLGISSEDITFIWR